MKIFHINVMIPTNKKNKIQSNSRFPYHYPVTT
jgi:hypothetical protein